MRIALINPTGIDHYSPCIRTLTSYLKQHGHYVRQIFLPADTYESRWLDRSDKHFSIKQLSDTMVEDLQDLVEDMDFVGVSFLTSFFDIAVHCTRAIQHRFPDKLIAWGGFHPTTMPQQALDFVDMVCVGEGEDSLLELVERLDDGKDFYDVRNFWFRKPNGKVVGNPHRPLIQDLDALPHQDFDLEDDWTWDKDKKHLIKVEWDFFKHIVPTYPDRNGDLRISYKTMITRGCPHKCSYCGVAFNHDLYKGQRYLRRRSVEHMVAEMKEVVRKFPELGLVHFQDDVFFSTSTEEIQKFSEHWKREIGMPFRAQCSPTTINEEKYHALIDAGLCFTELGIQTGSAETMRMYKRGMTNEQLLKAVNIIAKYKDFTQVPDYHFILDNPWESTEDVMKGLRLVLTGSNRDKLAHLVLNKNQPFYGSSITPFPLLGKDFTRAYTAHLNSHLAQTNQFSAADIDAAFDLVGRRPEMLRTIIGDVALELGEAENLGDLLRNSAELLRAGVWEEFESAYNALTLPQRAVLEVMADRAHDNQPFAPFADVTVLAVGKALETLGSDVVPGTQTIQAAIDSLRDKELVWKSSRGAYALEDKAFGDWIRQRRDTRQTA